jgi:serine phosphatase RsbU (regulator of sigma subunit)
MPLGMFREASFTSTRLQLGKGDMFFIYTDGLSEARGENGEYGIDRVMHLVGRQAWCSAAGLICACLQDVRGFAGANPGFDDLTLLAVRHAA